MAKIPEEVLLGMIANTGGGGTTNYNQLENLPQINGVTLSGNKSASDLSLASLDANGKVPSSQLPSFVYDVVEGYYDASTDRFYEESTFETVITPVEGKSWVDIPANKSYRWTGSVYVRVDEGVQIGETSDTAYAGNKGKANADAINAIKDGTNIDSFGDVETALAGKQGALTAGSHIEIDDDTISVNRWAVPAGKVVYTVITSDENYGQNVHVQRHTVDGGFIDDRTFTCVSYKTVNIDDLISIRNPYSSFNITLLEDSDEQRSGYNYTVNPITTPTSNSFTFTLPQEENANDLIIRSELDAEVNAIKDGQSIDSFADVESALADKQDKTDNNLETTSKTVVGAVNELKSGLTNLDNEVNGDATTYDFADVITIPDAVPANVADCKVKIEPVQDLHGYDKPWVGGAGKNKLPMTVDGIKAANTSGTWSGNTYTYNDIVYTLVTDNDGNIVKIAVNGTTTSRSFLIVGSMSGLIGQEVIMNGGASGGVASYTASGYCLFTGGVGVPQEYDIGSGATFTVSSYGGDVQINVNNTSVTNLDFKPMIRLATESDSTFAPYTNICPISGHTEVDVQRDGKNLFDPINVETFDATGQGDVRYGHRYNTGTYTIVNNMASESIFVRQVKNDLSEYGQYSTINALNYATINVNDGYMLYVYYQSLTEEQRKNVCVNKGNDTTFVPYQGKTYTIALGDTIYGGTVDFDSGVMTVDRAIVDLGTLTWQKDSGGHSRFVANKAGMKLNGTVIADCFQPGTYNEVYLHIKDEAISLHGTYSQFAIHSTYYETNYDATQFKTAMDGHYACYELATPTTIQLTPQQIQLLKGTNTLTASTGDISVTVNGVSGSIGAVQEQVNDHEERIEAVESGKVNVATYNMGGGQTVNIQHTGMVAIMSDRGGLYTDGIVNRGVNDLVPSTQITVTHVDSNNITVANNSQYGTSILVLSDDDITITLVQ